MVNIYCLIDPRNEKPFYVGATRLLPTLRLSCHLSSAKRYAKKLSRDKSETISGKKHELIHQIVSANLLPIIKVLEIANEDIAGAAESKHYFKLIQSGYDLLQAPKQLVYTKTILSRNKNSAMRQSVREI